MSDNHNPIEIAITEVAKYARDHLDKSDPTPEYNVYIVWFCYILGGWKCLASTSLPDGMYYELTYNHEKNVVYLDAYKKFDNNEIQL